MPARASLAMHQHAVTPKSGASRSGVDHLEHEAVKKVATTTARSRSLGRQSRCDMIRGRDPDHPRAPPLSNS